MKATATPAVWLHFSPDTYPSVDFRPYGADADDLLRQRANFLPLGASQLGSLLVEQAIDAALAPRPRIQGKIPGIEPVPQDARIVRAIAERDVKIRLELGRTIAELVLDGTNATLQVRDVPGAETPDISMRWVLGQKGEDGAADVFNAVAIPDIPGIAMVIPIDRNSETPNPELAYTGLPHYNEAEHTFSIAAHHIIRAIHLDQRQPLITVSQPSLAGAHA